MLKLKEARLALKEHTLETLGNIIGDATLLYDNMGADKWTPACINEIADKIKRRAESLIKVSIALSEIEELMS